MADGGDGKSQVCSRRREELDALVLRKVEELSSALGAARRVDDVVLALYSLAISLFSVDSANVEGCVDERHRDQVICRQIPDEVEREEQYHAFYRGASFPATARILLYNVAPNWLGCFPQSARLQVYDSFFLKGPACETLEALVSSLNASESIEDAKHNAVYSNIERLLVLFFLKNDGACNIFKELGDSYDNEKYVHLFPQKRDSASIIRMSQLVASVPDKARPAAPDSLSSHLFFKHIALQLVSAAYEVASQMHGKGHGLIDASDNGTFTFIGETFARICRRGSADVLVLVTMPMILDHIRSCFSSSLDSCQSRKIESRPESAFWILLMEEMRDSYAIERFSETLLHQLATQNMKDEEAYWILWMLFHRTYKAKVSTRYSDNLLFLFCHMVG